MQFASCWRQPAALFIWLPGESGQLGSAGLKVPGAPFLCLPPLGLGVEPKASGEEWTGPRGGYLLMLSHHWGRWKLGGPGRSMEPFLISKRLSCKDGGWEAVPKRKLGRPLRESCELFWL